MGSSPETPTSLTLLGRLREVPADPAAWHEFVRRYGPVLLGWCRHWKLQEADADDVTQTVLVHLADKLRSFRYDPNRSFRCWLKTITHHAWFDFLEDRRRPGLGSGDTAVLVALDAVEAREDLLARLQELFDRELLDEAMDRVRQHVEPKTWHAFWRVALENRPPVEVAGELGMTVAAVYMAKSRVQSKLHAEIAVLERPDQV